MADITIPGHLIVDTDPAFRNSLNTPKVSLSDNTPRENGVPPYPAVLTPVSPVEYDYQDLSLKTSNQYKTPNKLTVDAKYQFVLVPRGYRTIVVPEGSQTEVVTTKKMSHTQLISGGNSAGTPAPVSPPYQTSAQICTHPPLQKRQVTQKRIPRPANSFMTCKCAVLFNKGGGCLSLFHGLLLLSKASLV